MSSSYMTGPVYGNQGGSWCTASRFVQLTDRSVVDPRWRNSSLLGFRLMRRAP